MSDPKAGVRAELDALIGASRAYLEALRDSGVDELHWSPATVAAKATADVVAERRQAPAPAAPTPPVASESRGDPGIDRDERRRRLAVIAEEVAACTRCELHNTRTKTAFARGNPDSELVFIGEGPGTQEDLQGEPFVGPAGQLLDKMIAAMGYGRDDVYVMNVVKCRASEKLNPKKDRKPEPHEMEACRPFFDRQLELLNPKVIVALGATAVQGITGVTMGITRMRGTWRLFKGRIPLMPTFHPAYLLRSPEKKREVWDDLKQVMQRLGKEPPAKKNG
jgi:DNA polymerase